MLKSIQFNGQLGVRAIKIQNLPANHVLPTKFETGEAPFAQSAPQFLFLVGLVAAKLASDLFQAHANIMSVVMEIPKPLTPALSPFGGEREKRQSNAAATILPVPPSTISPPVRSSSR